MSFLGALAGLSVALIALGLAMVAGVLIVSGRGGRIHNSTGLLGLAGIFVVLGAVGLGAVIGL